jgi:flagellar basal-body rod protein FlgC
MDYLTSFEISGTGMTFERLRADVAAANLANMHTTRTQQGGPYKPLRAVASSDLNASSFENLMSSGIPSSALNNMNVEEIETTPRLVYEPGNPDANAKGYVAYPNINLVTEMVSMMTATRAYEANVSALNAAKAMALKALEIGGK